MRTRIIHAIAAALLGALAAPAATPEENGRAQTMSLIDADQKPAVEKSLRDLKSMSPAEAATTNKAVVTLVANQHSVAVTRGFNVVQDEPASVAGGATGPTPTDYFMAALGTCQNVVFVRYAALEQLAIEALETTVTGVWDRRGLYGIGGTDPGFREITLETRISTTAPAEKVAEAVRRTRRGCPIFATLRKETALTVRLVVNGQPVPL
jgi:putative redox protein